MEVFHDLLRSQRIYNSMIIDGKSFIIRANKLIFFGLYVVVFDIIKQIYYPLT